MKRVQALTRPRSATVLSNFLSSQLPSILTPSEIRQVSDSVFFINTLPAAQRDAVRLVYNEAYNEQLRVMLYFSIVVWVASLSLWERNMKTAKDVQGY